MHQQKRVSIEDVIATAALEQSRYAAPDQFAPPSWKRLPLK
jgi:hypothetical protein